MSTRNLRAAASQIFTTLDVDSNLKKMKSHLEEASRLGIEIVLFPECALSGYAPIDSTEESFPYDSEKLKDAADELQIAIRETGVAAIYGTAWKIEGSRWVNRARVVDPMGDLAGEVDKVHLIGLDHEYFDPAKTLNPVEVLGVKIGIGICFDIRFPEVWRKLSRAGAEILFNPLAAHGGGTWKLPVMSAHFCSRAAENQRFLVAANSGPIQMAVSEIYDPAGSRLAAARAETEELVWADLPLGEFEEKGRRHLPDFLDCLREDF